MRQNQAYTSGRSQNGTGLDMFGHKTNRALFVLLLLAAALPVPAMTPALLSGKIGLMAAVTEGPKIPLYAGLWRQMSSAPPALLGEIQPEPALMGWVEPEVVPTIPAETFALPSESLLTPITLITFPAFRPNLPFFQPPTEGKTRLPGGPLSPVPEPATWMLMISGFLLLGQALRRRRDPVTA